MVRTVMVACTRCTIDAVDHQLNVDRRGEREHMQRQRRQRPLRQKARRWRRNSRNEPLQTERLASVRQSVFALEEDNITLPVLLQGLRGPRTEIPFPAPPARG